MHGLRHKLLRKVAPGGSRLWSMTATRRLALRYSSSRTDPMDPIRPYGFYRSHDLADPTEATVSRIHHGSCTLRTSRVPPEPTTPVDPTGPTNPQGAARPNGPARSGTSRFGSARAVAGSGRGSAQARRSGLSENLGDNACENLAKSWVKSHVKKCVKICEKV